MKLSDFKYPLPRNLIAKFPAKPRDHSRLMTLNRADESIDDRKFCEIADYLNKGDCLVVNETKVFQARLFGKKEKTNAKIEVFLLRELNAEENIWDVIVDPARKVRIGNKIFFDNGKLWCEVIDNTTSRGRTVRFNHKGDFFKIIERIGITPLPYYIKRDANRKGQRLVPDSLCAHSWGSGGANRGVTLYEAAPQEDREQRGEGRSDPSPRRARLVPAPWKWRT